MIRRMKSTRVSWLEKKVKGDSEMKIMYRVSDMFDYAKSIGKYEIVKESEKFLWFQHFEGEEPQKEAKESHTVKWFDDFDSAWNHRKRLIEGCIKHRTNELERLISSLHEVNGMDENDCHIIREKS